MSRSKCVNAWRTRGSRAGRGAAPKPVASQAWADSASGNSGGAHNPPQMPRDGRRLSNTRPHASTKTMCVRRRRRGARWRATGSSCARPVANARQPDASGQRSHAGFDRTQIVAPRSMIACVYSATRLCGVQASASAHSFLRPAVESGGSSTTKTRASTRLTLPSRIGWRCPRARARIAPAVERPMPGSAINPASASGSRPACSLRMSFAAPCRFRARA